mmetsp:Transcript_7532/g.15692  ORF Transcript_7532/g.15692 Transcript_7532/m.15692 type:complete len:356 (+) Transcript_7532:164-1231(+)
MSDDPEAGVELQRNPTVRRNRGRPSADERSGRREDSPGARRRSRSPNAGGGRRASLQAMRNKRSGAESRRRRGRDDSDDDSDEDPRLDDDDNDDEEDEDDDRYDPEAPLNPSANKTVFKQSKKSKLWSTDITSSLESQAARMSSLRPLSTELTHKKYMFQQDVMRLLCCLIFAYSIVSFQVMCVYNTMCFDVADDPGNWHNFDYAVVPLCFLVGGIIVPFCMTLISQTNLTALKWGAFVQFVSAVVLSIFSGICYGIWDDYGTIRNSIVNNLNNNDYTAPYSSTNMRFSDSDVFYYALKETGNPTADAAELADTLQEKMKWMFLLTLAGGVLFLAQFSFSVSYLCHVYYGPGGRN